MKTLPLAAALAAALAIGPTLASGPHKGDDDSHGYRMHAEKGSTGMRGSEHRGDGPKMGRYDDDDDDDDRKHRGMADGKSRGDDMRANPELAFEKLDTNGDGVIDRDEFLSHERGPRRS